MNELDTVNFISKNYDWNIIGFNGATSQINHFSRRKQLIQLFKELGFKEGVEVGTDHGQYAEQLCAGIPDLRLWCIDPWVAYTEGTEVHTQEEMDQIYAEAIKRLINFNVSLSKMTSMEAVYGFEDNSLDFVFIDGNHEYEYVLEDITEWTRKVRSGGIVCGHDYKVDPVNKYGVIEAVNKYVKDNHIAPLFILHAGGSLVDCWCFIKQ